MANYYNINRSVEAYEFRTIYPNNGQLRNILDIAGSGGGGGGSVDLSNYYTKAETNNLFTPYYDSGEVDPELVELIEIFANIDGNQENTDKAMMVMADFCNKCRG